MNQFSKTPKIQGQDSIVINAPASILWPLIQDSKAMESWGPPVEKVDVTLLPDQVLEGMGSKRKVYAKFSEKRRGWYEEVRTGQEEGKSVTFMIFRDSFGMDKMLQDVGGKMEIEALDQSSTRFTFTFYHRPKNTFGWLMNPLIRKDQKKNRLKALQSIKSYVETGKPIKN
jgi:hypothetical protein